MKNKKTIIAIVLIGILAIGGTLAYYTSTSTFDNVFETAEYKTVATEVFESPTNWKPGDTTTKTITVTNEGDINARVRVCITDTWVAKDGTTELPNHDPILDIDIAVINPANTSDWTKSGNCYYYNDELEPNETTTSPIESVAFNSSYQGNVICTPNATGKVVTCETSGEGYDGATYTLTLTAETVQSEGLSVWGIGYYNSIDQTTGNPIYYSGVDDAIAATGYDTFLRDALTSDGIVKQVGFRYSGNDYYLTAVDGTKYEDNKDVLDEVLGSSNCHENTYPNGHREYICETPTLDATTDEGGFVGVTDYKTNGYFECNLGQYGGVCQETKSGYSSTGIDRFETPEEAMASSGKLNYLRYQINGKNVTSSVGFKVGDNLYYLVGGDEGASYVTNKAVLDSAFGVSNCTETTTSSSKYVCSNEYYSEVYADNEGNVYADEGASTWRCQVVLGGYSKCDDIIVNPA